MSAQGFERREFSADRIRPRRTAFTFSEQTPRYWLNGSVARTHLMNALHLFLPPFERMITRIVRSRALPLLSDPMLIQQARGFMAQETTHGRCHELFFGNLRAQGYHIDRYVAFLDWVFSDVCERRLGTSIGLALISAFEHYTDLFVPLILDSDFLDGCEPNLRELLEWHVAEEIEHNAVAFSILSAINDGKLLRLTGNLLGLGATLASLMGGVVMLLWQDGKLTQRTVLAELADFFFGKYQIARHAARLFVEYARPSYHPNDMDYSHLARQVLAPLHSSIEPGPAQ